MTRPNSEKGIFPGLDFPQDPRTGFSSPHAPTALLDAREGATVVVRAPAKVNLFLEILSKRGDGYHELETFMAAVSLYDTLAFTADATGAVRLACDHDGLSTGPDNLVIRAAERLRHASGCPAGAQVRLWKRIPMAAGLAGGSSDAAATLLGLNRLWQLGWSAERLAGLAAQLGSDIAFFVRATAAWCTGRGEVIEPCPLAGPLYFVLVCPPFGLGTAEVYRNVTVPAEPVSGVALRTAAAAGDVEALGRLLHNRLEEPAFRLRPELAALAERMRALGPAGVRMSGSGSTLFALCRDRAEAFRLAEALAPNVGERSTGRPGGDGLNVVVVRSCV